VKVLVETQSFDKGEVVPDEWARTLACTDSNLTHQDEEPYWTVKAMQKVTIVVTVYVGE
jgi:hypothetical protein